MGEFTAALSFNDCQIDWKPLKWYLRHQFWWLNTVLPPKMDRLLSYAELSFCWLQECFHTEEVSTLCSEFPAVCCNVASRPQNVVRDAVSAKTEPCAQWRGGTLLTSGCCSWDGSPAPKLRLQLNTQSVVQALQRLRPCPLHPHLVLAGSCPQPLPSMAMQVGQCLSHPLPLAGDRGDRMGRGCSDRHHGNTGSREKCQGSQPGLHRLCGTSVSLVWLLLGVPRIR